MNRDVFLQATQGCHIPFNMCCTSFLLKGEEVVAIPFCSLVPNACVFTASLKVTPLTQMCAQSIQDTGVSVIAWRWGEGCTEPGCKSDICRSLSKSNPAHLTLHGRTQRANAAAGSAGALAPSTRLASATWEKMAAVLNV